MAWRWLAFVVAFALVAIPRPAPSAEKEAGPTFTVRVQPIDTLLANLKQIATLAGKAEEAKQIDGFVRARIGDNGIDGIDVKRPFALYGSLNADIASSPTVALIPIASQKDFLELLSNFSLPATKGKDGIYTVTPEKLPLSFYLRFANKSVYVTTPDKAALKTDRLIAPDDLFTSKQPPAFAAEWYFDRVPDELKQIALSQLDLRVADLTDKKEPNETEAQTKLRVATLKEISRLLGSVVNDGRRFGARVDLDPASDLGGAASLSAKPKSKLADSIASLARKPSRFATLAAPGAAMSLTANFTLPAEIRKALGPVIDEGIQKSVDEEENEAKKKAGKKFLEALAPTLKTGELDAGFRLVGPKAGNVYTLSAGIKVKEGGKLLAAFREMAKTFPKTEQAIIQFDAEKSGKTAIHKIDGKKYYEDDMLRTLGNNPLYFAFTEDAILVTGGPGALAAMKELITAESAPAPLLQLEMSLSKLAPTIGKGTDAERQTIAKAAKDAFGVEGSDLVRMSVEGGTTLRGRFYIKPSVVRFLAAVEKVNQTVEKRDEGKKKVEEKKDEEKKDDKKKDEEKKDDKKKDDDKEKKDE